MFTTIILATTDERFDGHRFTLQELVDTAAYLNQWGERKYNKEPVPLPQFQGYPGHGLRAWVDVLPFPASVAVLYVRGCLTKQYERLLQTVNFVGQGPLQAMLVPAVEVVTPEDKG